jgi:hypothetical protein
VPEQHAVRPGLALLRQAPHLFGVDLCNLHNKAIHLCAAQSLLFQILPDNPNLDVCLPDLRAHKHVCCALL